MVWNEREHTREEREMVYEISWVGELGLWRSFVAAQGERLKSPLFANVVLFIVGELSPKAPTLVCFCGTWFASS